MRGISEHNNHISGARYLRNARDMLLVRCNGTKLVVENIPADAGPPRITDRRRIDARVRM